MTFDCNFQDMKNKGFPIKLIVLFLIVGFISSGCDPLDSGNQQLSTPIGVSATALSDNSILVSWNAVADAASYDVHFTVGTSSTRTLAGNTIETSFTHTGLDSGTRYTYFVTAKNSSATSSSSSAVSETTEFMSRIFWAYNFVTETDYQLTAELLVQGTNSNVWVDRSVIGNSRDVYINMAQILANTYDNQIYPRMISAFGVPLTYNGISFPNPMALADWLGDDDGKLAILMYPMAGDYDGFFWYEDLFDTNPVSNRSDIIHVSIPASYNVIAHEMQHLMNFVTGLALRGLDGYQDIWIDEGLSAVAEWIGTGEHNEGRVVWFNDGGSGLIDMGNNFFVWDNHANNEDAIFDDYATVYLFFHWLRLEAGGEAVLRNITTSNFFDFRAVTTSMNTVVPGRDYSTWATLLRNWMLANYLNNPSGPYGYKNDPLLRYVEAFAVEADVTQSRLFPGEGLFSITDASAAPNTTGQGANIRRTFISNSGLINDTQHYRGGSMLSYNINSNIDGASELARVSMAADANASSRAASVSRTAQNRPTRIDARDIFRRNGGR